MAKLPGPCALSPIGLQRYALILAIPLALSVSYRPAVAQTFSNFSLPAAYCTPALASCILDGITAGPDGALWFTEYNGNVIGRITTAGVFTEYTLPQGGSEPFWITTGPDGNLWFTDMRQQDRQNHAGWCDHRIRPTNSGFPLRHHGGPGWCAVVQRVPCNEVGRITTAGAITYFTVAASGSDGWGITTGPDGNLWIAGADGDNIEVAG